MSNFLLKTPLAKIPLVRRHLERYSNPLLSPVIILLLGITTFSTGFLASLWQIEYWHPIYFSKVDRRPLEERARAELDQLRKMALELDSWGNAQKKREQALNEREEKINQAENNLKLEMAVMEKLNKQIESMRAQMEARLSVVNAAQEVNVKQLSKLYSAMSPEAAANVLAGMSDNEVAQIIRQMKENRSAKILDVWSAAPGPLAEKATRVSIQIKQAAPPPTENPE
ncbi:MAG: hypothetical protein PHV34_17030 [Verrucomicrobiae bacterium]|nr:hypothetical protein [Verrucomicrobiae bacterium]